MKICVTQESKEEICEKRGIIFCIPNYIEKRVKVDLQVAKGEEYES